MTLSDVGAALTRNGLTIVGAWHPEPDDRAPPGIETLCLVGADGARMWDVFQLSAEAANGEPNPLDRWSARVIGEIAEEHGATALFPFGGPPYQPFQLWAERGEGAVPSPVGMQVTAGRGLWTSYRGALGFAAQHDFSPPRGTGNPCLGCPAPCMSACPVDAFAGGSYDVPRCVAHITSPKGTRCREGGCLVRHACPPGVTATPPATQCAFHMEAFIRARLATD
ncbi:MAG: ferredoxin [Paracoccaceae bacterium]|nr:ferredoxin [Paracoccaceae bacterium]